MGTHFFRQFLPFLLTILSSISAHASSYTLQQLLGIALTHNPAIALSRAQAEAAEAGIVTAKSYYNPEVSFGAGPTRYRNGDQGLRTNWNIAVSQKLEFSDLRAARRELAERQVDVSSQNIQITRRQLIYEIKTAFYSVLQRQSFLDITANNKSLLTEIRDRVKLRADLGEAPKYELIKANTELLAAERDYQSAQTSVQEAKLYLLGLLGKTIEADFALTGELPTEMQLPSLDELRAISSNNPALKQMQLMRETAQAQLTLEERLRLPGVTLNATMSQDPDLANFNLGVSIPLPLWNKREGQIAEASAQLKQTEANLEARSLGLQRELNTAYQRYQIAQNQLHAFESGLLDQSQAVLKTAEAAYKFGERGILEYLDAQRTFRNVRKDYLNAKFDYVSSLLEIERLMGAELFKDKDVQQ